jgi:murein DD-endopeptidase MepM/ murein hydrolase activator NlpD
VAKAPGRVLRALFVLLIVALCAGADVGKAPWRARRRPDTTHNKLAAERVQPSDWPAEPESPASIDADRFTKAIASLCLDPTSARARERADLIRAQAEAFAIDPFLLGALVYRTSRCRADKEELGGFGLTLLPMVMYQDGFKAKTRRYAYQTLEGAAWREKTLELPRFAFIPATLLKAEPNLYFAAALLAMWRDQHASVDAAFEQAPHRHFVSHFIWGDKVKSGRAEDRVLGDRRRLLEYYGSLPQRAPIAYRGLQLGSPLDGAPRVVSSGLGFMREDGQRSHRGIDLESEFGEPVRAIEAGLVTFSGVDLPGQRNHEQLTVEQTNAFDRKVLGHGGRYVCVQHAPSDGKFLRSCYMHLETVEVAYGARVERGQKLGTVGRTGMQTSSPHLHLELLGPEGLFDGAEILRGHVIGTPVELEPPRKKRRRG